MNRDHRPAPVDLTAESVAGEEDPGASMDPTASPDPAVYAGTPGSGSPAEGARGTGTDGCSKCGGSGKFAGITCTACEGRGRSSNGAARP